MPLDSFCIAGLARELDARLAGARLDKIHMPGKDRVVLQLRAESGPERLLLAAGSDARAHLTSARPENPAAPPMLCMLLRKHLGGGRVTGVRQPGRERVLEVLITAAGELGDITQKRLICEMTGRMTNLILVGEDGLILACLRPVGHEQSPRPVLPGLRYQPPPAQELPDFAGLAEDALAGLCRRADPAEPERWLLARVSGLPPLALRECLHRAGPSPEALWRELAGLQSLSPQPYMLERDGLFVDFAALPITHLPGVRAVAWPGFSALLDDFYRERDEGRRRRQLSAGVARAAETARGRLVRKLAGQRQELVTAAGREELRRRADLITANLHALPEAAARAVVTDYYDPEMPQVAIDLDPRLTPRQNAERLYRRYARLKNAEQALTGQIALGEAELVYLDSVLYAISAAATAREVEAVEAELVEGGYLRGGQKAQKRRVPPAQSPRRFALMGGFTALCGRNNTENDWLTHRHAARGDLWLHARGIPGSHVVVRLEGREITPAALMEAAALAAWYSSGRTGGRVAVDYTPVRLVKKAPGARPGQVHYTGFKTVQAVPALPPEEE